MSVNKTSPEISFNEHGTAGKSWELLASLQAEEEVQRDLPFF
jgi:hypothetical protein